MLALSRWVISLCVCTRELSSRDLGGGGGKVGSVHVCRGACRPNIPSNFSLANTQTTNPYGTSISEAVGLRVRT